MDPESLLKKLLPLEKRIGHVFRHKNRLLQSMLHASFVNEHRELKLQSNERLEFLGDAVLDLVISEHLMNAFPTEDEGVLSIKRAALVREATLAAMARSLRIQQYLILGQGEIRDGGHKRDSLLGDGLEALLGAVYLDSGLKAARKVILRLFKVVFQGLQDIEQSYNFKNQLQQLAQSQFRIQPRYKVIGTSGPEHCRRFKVGVYLEKKFLTWGSGSSIKKAEQTASKNALRLLKEGNGKSN